MKQKAYAITWTNAHGETNTTIRFGRQAADFITALFDTPGCDLVGVLVDSSLSV